MSRVYKISWSIWRFLIVPMLFGIGIETYVPWNLGSALIGSLMTVNAFIQFCCPLSIS